MHRLLVAAASAALIAATAAPALAQGDYPPCTSPTQDHCRVVTTHHVTHHRRVVRRHHVTHKSDSDHHN